MKRRNSNQEAQKDIILKLLNESQSYEAIQLFLSKLNPNELYALANIPELKALRAYLKGPGMFKTLFEIRARTPNPVSAVERDILEFMRWDKKMVNYWKLWLCAWETVNSDEDMVIAFDEDAVNLQIVRGWYAESVYRLRFLLDFDQTKLPVNQFEGLYPEEDAVWHPVARTYQMHVVAMLKHMTGLEEIDDVDVEPEHIAGDRYYIGDFSLGKNDASNGDPLYFAGDLIPRHTLHEYGAEAAFAKYQKKPRSQLYERVMNAEYQAENLVWVFDCFNRGLIAFFLLTKYPTAFLKVERADYGVSFLKSCIVCENPAYYQERESKAYVCGEPGCVQTMSKVNL